MNQFESMDQGKTGGMPEQLPSKYDWDQVKDKITEEELKRLNELVDLAPSWTGENDPNYQEWKKLDERARPGSSLEEK